MSANKKVLFEVSLKRQFFVTEIGETEFKFEISTRKLSWPKIMQMNRLASLGWISNRTPDTFCYLL